MLDHLKQLYSVYPGILFAGASDMRSVTLPPVLDASLRIYRDGLLRDMATAKIFRIEPSAMDMMFGLIREMKTAAFDDAFASVRFPFPSMFLECVTEDGSRRAGLLVQRASAIEAQVFAGGSEGYLPSLLRGSITVGTELDISRIPTLELVEILHGPARQLEDEASQIRWFIALAVALSILMSHKGMLETEERHAYSRAERRRSEREGRHLPDTRMSVIRLGEVGRVQLAVTNDRPGDSAGQRRPVRAHWVRGHFMRNPSGSLSWRMPHLRGTGPVINQIRRVEI